MIWYPYQQMKTMKDPYKITDAEGVWLYTKDRRMIDSEIGRASCRERV